MDTELKNHLKSLADKYENKEFLDGDPSWFMHQVTGDTNKELLAFVASGLSYGARAQFLPKIQFILDASMGNMVEWLTAREYRNAIPDNERCYYRLYTNHTMLCFLDALHDMVMEYGNIKNYIIHETPLSQKGDTSSIIKDTSSISALDAIELLTRWFRDHGSEGIIPKDCKSSCKRLCMFLRWMVRSGSPVDLGLWSDIIDRRTLIIPMDTHVMQQACRLGLLESKTASMSSAIKLTEKLKSYFPDDPAKGDFALFGSGVGSLPSREI